VSAAPPSPATSPDARSHSIEEGATFSVVVASAAGDVLRANATFLGLLGYPTLDAIRGKSLPRGLLKRATDWKGWADVAAGAPARDVNAEFLTATGESVCLRGRIVGAPRALSREPAVRAVLVDDTAGQHLRALAARTARIEGALGLSAGISHDFNNLLTVLVGNLYLVSEALREQPAQQEKVRKARDAAKRGAELARQLTNVSRGTEAESPAVALHLGRILEALTPLLAAALGPRIELRSEIAADIPPVFANRAELESVITNLVINARDALAGRSGACVLIGVRRRDLLSPSDGPQLSAGSYVELAVTDNGCGIPKEVADRVFEPFFSTKQRGQGSGLGLAMVWWFAERAGGTVSLKSGPGEGTTVAVLLPAHHAEAAETAIGTMPLSSLPGGNETVLVVSADQDFRSTVEQILGALGYHALSGGVSALAVTAHHERAAVVILDAQSLTPAAVERVDMLIRRRGERTGAVLVGDSRIDWPGGTVRVPKPFTLLDLATAVRTAIKGGG
jgi:signal transduction histidine kinase